MNKLGVVLVLVGACAPRSVPPRPEHHDRLSRAEFNRFAVRTDTPLFWVADRNANKQLDPDELAGLLFYPGQEAWTEHGQLTPAFEAAYNRIVAAQRETLAHGRLVPDGPDDPDGSVRRKAVARELDLGPPALVRSELPADAVPLATHLAAAARAIDRIYARQTGGGALAALLPHDRESQSLFRRNHGPSCLAFETRSPACSAIPGTPAIHVDVYPAALQLGAQPACPPARDPYSVRRADRAIPYATAYADDLTVVARELDAAAAATSGALATYLHAAATASRTNDWAAADAAWAAVTPETSPWYVRVGPDDTAWEPCHQHAGFHLTFARFVADPWPARIAPLVPALAGELAALAGTPARELEPRLPRVAELVFDAGYDHAPRGAAFVRRAGGSALTLTNLYSDPDSVAARREALERIVDPAAAAQFGDRREPFALAVALRELATQLAPPEVMPELARDAATLYLIEALHQRGVLDEELATRTITAVIELAFADTSALYDAAGARLPEPRAVEIVLGVLAEQRALVYRETAKSANGNPGAIELHVDRLAPAITELAHAALGLTGRADRAGAEALERRYRDEKLCPFGLIAHRFRTAPIPSFVYAVTPAVTP